MAVDPKVSAQAAAKIALARKLVLLRAEQQVRILLAQAAIAGVLVSLMSK